MDKWTDEWDLGYAKNLADEADNEEMGWVSGTTLNSGAPKNEETTGKTDGTTLVTGDQPQNIDGDKDSYVEEGDWWNTEAEEDCVLGKEEEGKWWNTFGDDAGSFVEEGNWWDGEDI